MAEPSRAAPLCPGPLRPRPAAMAGRASPRLSLEAGGDTGLVTAPPRPLPRSEPQLFFFWRGLCKGDLSWTTLGNPSVDSARIRTRSPRAGSKVRGPSGARRPNLEMMRNRGRFPPSAKASRLCHILRARRGPRPGRGPRRGSFLSPGFLFLGTRAPHMPRLLPGCRRPLAEDAGLAGSGLEILFLPPGETESRPSTQLGLADMASAPGLGDAFPRSFSTSLGPAFPHLSNELMMLRQGGGLSPG
jgi:hypothetical protein